MSYRLPFLETAWIVFQEQLPLFPEENLQALRAGDHVADKSYPSETLGVVTEIEDGEVHIVMPEWMVERDYFTQKWDREGWREASELIRTEGYSVQELAGAIYGRMGFHHFYNIQRSHFAGWRHTRLFCQHKECREAAIGVGIVNNWGTVMPFAMCIEHTEYHGMCCESLPFTGKVQEKSYA